VGIDEQESRELEIGEFFALPNDIGTM